MPRAVKKSTSRCSSSCSSRNSHRKGQSPADNPLSANRFSPLEIEAPPRAPVPEPPTPAPVQLDPPMQKIKKPKKIAIPKLPEANIVPQKPKGIFQHGIRYILLPLHLLHLRVWGSRSSSSSETNEKKTSSLKSEKIEKKSSPFCEGKNDSSASSTSSKSSSASASSSRSSSPSATSSSSSGAEKIASVASSLSSASSSVPTDKSPTSNRRIITPGRILREENPEDSDEMVTAPEDDDSSNEQWSNALSTPSMNMSIDLESHGQMDKASSSSTGSSALEEPMDVSSLEDKRLPYQESSDSSVDREIANVFENGCSSSSSDDEDYDESNGRRNNMFLVRSSRFGPLRSGARFRKAMGDAAIRKRRTLRQYDRLPEVQANRINGSSSGSRSSDERSVDLLKIKVTSEEPPQSNPEVVKTANQTDSAYSEEDVEMNSINESIIRLLSMHVESLQESVVEWMDQDQDHVADTEDSNDGSLPASSKSTDQGFVDRLSHSRSLGSPLGDWNQISGLETSMLSNPNVPKENGTPLDDWNAISGLETSMLNDPNVPKENTTPLGDWNAISGLETSMLNKPNDPKGDSTPLGDWNNISGLETSTPNGPNIRADEKTPLEDWNEISALEQLQLHSPIVAKKNGTPLGDWKEISGLGASVNTQTSFPQKPDADLFRQPEKCQVETLDTDVDVAGGGPPDFPEVPQLPDGNSCDCGDPSCFFVPLAIPANSSTAIWTRNYTEPPTPMRHLYYEYPEFMNPPGASGDYQWPYVLIPVPGNSVGPESE